MANLVVEFDTKEKTMSVKMDGKDMTDVAHVEFFSGFEDDFHATVVQRSENADDGTMIITRTVANEQGVTANEEKGYDTKPRHDEDKRSKTRKMAKALFRKDFE